MLGIILAGSVFLEAIARRRPARLGTFARVFAVVIVAYQAPLLVCELLPGQWTLGESLPLQLCDLAWPVAVYALWTRRQWAYALVYYWGLTLVPQAITTTALNAPDFPNPSFLQFWGQHVLVVWAAVYLTWECVCVRDGRTAAGPS